MSTNGRVQIIYYLKMFSAQNILAIDFGLHGRVLRLFTCKHYKFMYSDNELLFFARTHTKKQSKIALAEKQPFHGRVVSPIFFLSSNSFFLSYPNFMVKAQLTLKHKWIRKLIECCNFRCCCMQISCHR